MLFQSKTMSVLSYCCILISRVYTNTVHCFPQYMNESILLHTVNLFLNISLHQLFFHHNSKIVRCAEQARKRPQKSIKPQMPSFLLWESRLVPQSVSGKNLHLHQHLPGLHLPHCLDLYFGRCYLCAPI